MSSAFDFTMEQQRIAGSLTLNLSLPILTAIIGEPAYPRQESTYLSRELIYPKQDTANQVINEFVLQLARNLANPGALNTQLRSRIRSSFTLGDRGAVAEAVQELAAEFAFGVAEQFPIRLAQELAVLSDPEPTPAAVFLQTQGLPPRPETPPQTPKFDTDFRDFIATDLSNVIDPGDQSLRNKAAHQAQQVSDEFGLSSEDNSKLARVALYDIVILCGRLSPP
jgi:hypothetical protein